MASFFFLTLILFLMIHSLKKKKATCKHNWSSPLVWNSPIKFSGVLSICLLLIFLFLTQRSNKAMIKNILNGSWGQRGYLRGWTPYNWQGGPTIKSYQVWNSNIPNAENSYLSQKKTSQRELEDAPLSSVTYLFYLSPHAPVIYLFL